jgi:large subunit ribosomal protein L25
MKSVLLTAYPRTLSRRAGANRLRRAARVPAVIYGRHTQPQNLELALKDIEDLIHHSASENLLIDLHIKDDARPPRLALVKEVQHHVVSGKILHVDFHEVSAQEKVVVSVPVEPVGEAIGVKSGGILEHVLFKVKVRALPRDLPEVLKVDVSHLEIGKAVHIGEIPSPPGVEILGDRNISVIAVAAPITEAEAAAAETAAAVAPTEVEVIKEKKEPGEVVEAEAAKAAGKPAEKAPEKAAEKVAEKKVEKKK